jgi:hypothetical protein
VSRRNEHSGFTSNRSPTKADSPAMSKQGIDLSDGRCRNGLQVLLKRGGAQCVSARARPRLYKVAALTRDRHFPESAARSADGKCKLLLCRWGLIASTSPGH